jgi:carbonic anhydrase
MVQFDEGRRGSIHTLLGAGIALCSILSIPRGLAAVPTRTSLSPDQALALLKEGNARFIADRPQLLAQGKQRRLEIAHNQTPIAVVVSCSDSRVPPELVFGRGLGELFIVRNAGNTIDTGALGSIEYAVTQLGVPLIVVMGHERCGAVDAALSVVERQATFSGSIGRMVEPILPAVLQAKAGLKDVKHSHDALLDASVRENVHRVVKRLRESEALLLEPLQKGKLMIVGARYDLDDGRVEFF